jgi:methylmalonyl-CoA/ethylmalonyl-CoA epimerase
MSNGSKGDKMPAIKRIDHIAVIVDNLETALAFWREALGMELDHTLEIPNENAIVAFLPAGDSEIELVKPTSADSGLGRYLEKRGPGMHHVCLEVEDIEGVIARLKEKGIELINETPRLAANGKKYAFVHPKSAFGVMIELYEVPA